MLSICLTYVLITSVTSLEVNIWGPGLEPDIYTLPARYFFINITDNDVLEKEIDVEVLGKTNNRRTRIWTQLLNRKDGSYIARYKLYEPCNEIEINVRYNNVHLAESPYLIGNVVYSEDCDCPQYVPVSFLNAWKCVKEDQVQRDLSNFKDVNWDLIRDLLIKEYNNPGAISLCHYVLKDNKIYRNCYGRYVGFKMFMDNMLLSITRKIVMPDMEFFVNLGDWPLVKNMPNYPVFSWCGSLDTFDIVMPTYDISESTLENMGGVTLDMLSVQGNIKDVWNKRIPKVFWRGRDSKEERLKLVNISREYPDLFNVSITNFFFYRDKIDLYGPKVDHVSFFDFFNYKYQASIDGTVAAYRFPYLLAGGSLIFKQESKYYEHFYNDLKPNRHYVQIRRDLEDLVDKVKWALDNDEESFKIAKEAQRFAFEKLLPVNVYCYYVSLLNEFSKKIVSHIRIFPEMEQVVYTKAKDCKCSDDLQRDEL